MTRYRGVEKGGGVLPGTARAILLVAVIALAGAFALVATGAIGSAVASLGGSIGGMFGDLTGSPTPAASDGTVPDAVPRLEAPDEPYTSNDSWDLRGLLPSGVAGSDGLTLRVFVGDEQVDEVPVPPTTDFLITAIPLVEGENQITAAIVGPNGEGPRSAPIVVILDTKDPGLSVSAPDDGSRVKASVETVTVKGKTQPGANVAVRNGNTGGSASDDSKEDGTFAIKIGIADGTNTLTVTATDQAGNETTKTVSILRGSGKLTAKVGVSPGRLRASRLPEPFTVRATVADVGGKRVPGATVVFSLSPPGQPTSTYTTETNDNGIATWRVTVPRAGTVKGAGLATVEVTLLDGRTVSGSNAFEIY
jgi:glucodextranase-like protein